MSTEQRPDMEGGDPGGGEAAAEAGSEDRSRATVRYWTDSSLVTSRWDVHVIGQVGPIQGGRRERELARCMKGHCMLSEPILIIHFDYLEYKLSAVFSIPLLAAGGPNNNAFLYWVQILLNVRERPKICHVIGYHRRSQPYQKFLA